MLQVPVHAEIVPLRGMRRLRRKKLPEVSLTPQNLPDGQFPAKWLQKVCGKKVSDGPAKWRWQNIVCKKSTKIQKWSVNFPRQISHVAHQFRFFAEFLHSSCGVFADFLQPKSSSGQCSGVRLPPTTTCVRPFSSRKRIGSRRRFFCF